MQRTDLLTEEIHWPEKYLPAKMPVFGHNEITIAAPVEAIWAWLIRAESWPEWYENAQHIHFLSTSGPNLRDRSRFRWKTFNTRVTSKVLEFEPCVLLAWDAHGIGVEAYHRWLLTPLGDGTVRVVTEEVQHGWRARLGKMLMPKRMERMHQIWLEGLRKRAELGFPESQTRREKAS
jgi:uncharacterized protein YndB with AHSA1/START domain